MTSAARMEDAQREALRHDLASMVQGGRASSEPADRTAYARDLWPRQQIRTRRGEARPSPPAVIVWPANAEEVSRVVSYACKRGIAVVPFGAGSGVCGGILPTPETIVLDLKRMRGITSLDGQRLRCDAEAGIMGQVLEDRLASHGFTLGHFPSSIYCSTLGGWVAARSAGQCSGRYGKIEDMVLGLDCVDGTGERWRADAEGEGAALLPLVIGSEGTLAVVTDVRLRLAPAPPARRFTSFTFASTRGGLEAIRAIYQAGLRPAVARLYDPFDSLVARRGKKGHRVERARDAVPSDRSKVAPGLGTRMLMRALRSPGALNALIHGLPGAAWGGAMLVLVWEDHPEIAEAEVRMATALCSEGGGRDLGEGPARRWLERRHAVSYRQSPMYASGAFVDTMEVASSWSRLWPMYEAVHHALSRHVFVMAHFSHAYPDGASIYFTFAGAAANDERALEVYDAAWRDALVAVVDAGGTLSHHHGVGRSKAPAMRREQGTAVDVVRSLKAILDPAHILNPGALLPHEDGPDGT